MQVQSLLKKLAGTEVKTICSLHGPVLTENIAHYIELYDKWSKYEPEESGVVIAYTSVYGHTEKAVKKLACLLEEKGAKVAVYDLARCDRAQCVAEAFRYDKLVLATTTYNGDIFPAMREFIDCLTERNFRYRKVAFMENGSWAPVATAKMKAKLQACKNLEFADTEVKIHSALNGESMKAVLALAEEMA